MGWDRVGPHLNARLVVPVLSAALRFCLCGGDALVQLPNGPLVRRQLGGHLLLHRARQLQLHLQVAVALHDVLVQLQQLLRVLTLITQIGQLQTGAGHGEGREENTT